jgi:integrase
MRKIRFHDLRHTCASTMIANGETPLAVMKQLRHSSIQQTMDTYGHLFPDKTDEAMSRLGDALFGGLDDF